MNVNDFIHQEDKEALEQLKAIPLFGSFMKFVLKFYQEQMIYGSNMAQKIRLSPKQIPHLYNLLPPIVEKLGIYEPELYLEMNPYPNAYVMGESRTSITITSGLVDMDSEDELRAVLAHECGHILCHHLLYTTMVNVVMRYCQTLPEIMNSALVALRYWNRKSELSCDRVSAYVTSPGIAASSLSRLSGGPERIMYDFDLNEYVKQSDIYESIRTGNAWDKTLQTYNTLWIDHPYNAVRVRELLKWTSSKHYIDLMAGIPMCPKCHEPIKAEWDFCKKCGNSLK